MIQALEGTGETAGRFLLSPSLARGGAGGVVWNRELQQHDPELIVLLVGFWEDKIVGEEASAAPGWAQQYRRTGGRPVPRPGHPRGGQGALDRHGRGRTTRRSPPASPG